MWTIPRPRAYCQDSTTRAYDWNRNLLPVLWRCEKISRQRENRGQQGSCAMNPYITQSDPYAKKGAHKERPPQDPDWWYARCASLLRKIYVHGPVGVSRLRVQYGGNVGRGNSPEHHGRAGGSAIREPLQQLQKAELVAIEGRKGRKLTKQGLTLLNRTSAEVAKELKARPREAPS